MIFFNLFCSQTHSHRKLLQTKPLKFPYCCLQFLFEHILRQCNACSCCIKHFLWFCRWNRTTWVSTSHFCLFSLFLCMCFLLIYSRLLSFVWFPAAVFCFRRDNQLRCMVFRWTLHRNLECTEIPHTFENAVSIRAHHLIWMILSLFAQFDFWWVALLLSRRLICCVPLAWPAILGTVIVLL